MIKKILIVFLGLTIILFILNYIFKNNKDPFENLLQCDKDEAYDDLLSYKENLDSLNFEKLVLKILSTQNMDMFSTQTLVRYIRENTKCAYLEGLKVKASFYHSLPEDTVWDTKIGANKYRRNSVSRTSAALSELDDTILLLDSLCPNHKI